MPPRRKRTSLSHYTITESTRLLREMTGRKHVLLAGRGAAGIGAALRALGLRDEYVLLPANTCYIVLWGVLKSGNRPLLADVDREKPSAFSRPPSAKDHSEPPRHRDHREKKPKVVIPCHMYGIGAPIQAMVEWARAEGVYVIEDAALALGATVDGRPAGAWGDVSVFSFGLGKIVDHQVGGAVLTDDDHLAKEIEEVLVELPVWDDRMMRLTNQWNAIYWALHQYEADNPRLPELYPTLYSIYGELTGYQLSRQDWGDLPGLLRDLPANIAHRRAMAEGYDELLDPPPNPLSDEARLVPTMRRGEENTNMRTLLRTEKSVLWRYPLLVEAARRDELLQYLWENGVPDATRWYPSLRTMTAALAPDVEQPPTPGADDLGARMINLRIDPVIDRAYVERTARLIREYFSENPVSLR